MKLFLVICSKEVSEDVCCVSRIINPPDQVLYLPLIVFKTIAPKVMGVPLHNWKLRLKKEKDHFLITD